MEFIFVPLKEEYYPTKYTIYQARFKLGFFGFTIHLVDSKGTLNPAFVVPDATFPSAISAGT